jgi:hypothetical protein
MAMSTGRKVTYAAMIGGWAAAHLLLWLDAPPLVFAACLLMVTVVVPGVLAVELVLAPRRVAAGPAERLVTGLATGYGILIVGMVLLSYLPGGVAAWQVLLLFDAVSIALAVGLYLTTRDLTPGDLTPGDLTPGTSPEGEGRTADLTPGSPGGEGSTTQRTTHDSPRTSCQSPITNHHSETRRLWLAVGAAVVMGALLRLPNLGYAEFHGDEARAVLRAAAVLQGYEEVLFVHRKGPAEIVMPAAHFAVGGTLTEAAARLPFALASLAALAAAVLIGWRVFGAGSGLVAGLLLAVDGYYVAFGRFVQYQSVVLLLGAAAVLMIMRVHEQPATARRRIGLTGFLLGAGLLAHYDVLAAAIPVAFLWFALTVGGWQERKPPMTWGALLRESLPGIVIGVGVVALYYAPALLSDYSASTVAYLRDERLTGGGGWLTNNLGDFVLRGALYSTTWLLMTMALLGLAAVAWALVRGYGARTGRWLALTATVALIAIGFALWQADAVLGDATLPMLAFLTVFALTWMAPRLPLTERALWIWWGVPALIFLFLVATPRTHVHAFLMPWALLAGGVTAAGIAWMDDRIGRWAAVAASAAAAVGVIFLAGGAWATFVWHGREVVREGSAQVDRFYPRPPSSTAVDGRFGFPFKNGWKAVGVAYERGEIAGDFETNQRYAWVPMWYTRGQERCASSAAWVFAGDVIEPWAEDNDAIADRLQAQGFAPWQQVTVDGRPRMVIYEAGGDGPVSTVAAETVEPTFDAAAGWDLQLDYPVIYPPIATPVGANLGGEVLLEGYTLALPDSLRPGETFALTLFWRGQRPLGESYKVFTQAIDESGRKAAQQDGLPVCDQEPTPTWSPGELIVDRRVLRVEEGTPAGRYTLVTGLYREETGERLPVLDASGAVVDNKVVVGEVVVGRP